jgi:hypothetical protein
LGEPPGRGAESPLRHFDPMQVRPLHRSLASFLVSPKAGMMTPAEVERRHPGWSNDGPWSEERCTRGRKCTLGARQQGQTWARRTSAQHRWREHYGYDKVLQSKGTWQVFRSQPHHHTPTNGLRSSSAKPGTARANVVLRKHLKIGEQIGTR